VSHSAALCALGTSAAVVVAEPGALPAARRALLRELDAIELACSRFRPDSELVALNAAAGSALQVSPLLFEAVEVALRVARRTGGLVDPTVGRALRLSGYDRTFERVRVRDGDTFRPRFELVRGWRSVELERSRRAIRVPKGVELDLGATAKALAADRAALAASRAAGTGVLVSLGGDVAVAGPAPAPGWPVKIAEDHAAPLDAPGPTVSIRSGGLATSGTAVRRWRAGGAELHHIVDPRTGRPAETPWTAVTVAAASCVDANAASTAAVVLGRAGPEWLAERRLPARLQGEDGTVVCAGGWPEDAW
jgi:thiamine biosynthesis lipoprotein